MVGIEAATPVCPELDWTDDINRSLEPFMEEIGHRTRRRMRPVYVGGPIDLGNRKSVQPMAACYNSVSYDQPGHFIGSGV